MAAWVVKAFGTWWASDVEQARAERSARNLGMLELLEQPGGGDNVDDHRESPPAFPRGKHRGGEQKNRQYPQGNPHAQNQSGGGIPKRADGQGDTQQN